jgi:hypothetical protein
VFLLIIHIITENYSGELIQYNHFACKEDIMGDHLSSIPEDKKKLLEKSVMGGIAVPIAIILLGALIIFGVTKMLSTEKSYKNLVEELHSKTFGNRWIAAYELSKVLNGKRVPKDDYPWLIENLSEVFKKSKDARTRNFIILALGSLKSNAIIKTLEYGVQDSDPKVVFNSIVTLGNLKPGFEFDWSKVESKLTTIDAGVQQVSVYALAQHNISSAEQKIINLLKSEAISVRYAASIGLIYYKNEAALQTLNEILVSDVTSNKVFNEAELTVLKLSIFKALQNKKWKVLRKTIAKIAENNANAKIATTAKETLNLLKN